MNDDTQPRGAVKGSADGREPPGGRAGERSRTRDLGILAIVVLGPIWGYGWVATKVALGYSQPLTFAALRVVLTYTMPFWLLLLAWAFLGERLRGVQWLAVILSFAGLVLVVSPWQIHGVTSSVLTVAGAAGLGTLAIPVVGVVAAWLQLGERPTAVEAAGMALIVAALAILAARGLLVGRRERSPRRDETSVPRAPH